MPKRARIAVVPDLHAPYTDGLAFDWCLDVLDRRGPFTHIVQLGDWLDTEPANTHPGDKGHTQREEYEVAALQSRRLREAVGHRCRKIRLLGNHEDRLEPHRANTPRHFRDSLHWTDNLQISREWAHWLPIPYIKGVQGCYQVGPVILYHGFDTAQNSDEIEAVQMVGLCGGYAHRLCVRGHTHVPVGPLQAFRTKKAPLPYWYLNAGHLGPALPDWARTKGAFRWGHAMAIIECAVDPDVWMQGKSWDAQLLTWEGGR